MLGLIKRNIENKSQEIVSRLYKQLVRPHLEYAIQAWSPWLCKDKQLIEKVQRRAPKMIQGMCDLSYEEWLESTGLTTLEVRRARGDQGPVSLVWRRIGHRQKGPPFGLSSQVTISLLLVATKCRRFHPQFWRHLRSSRPSLKLTRNTLFRTLVCWLSTH